MDRLFPIAIVALFLCQVGCQATRAAPLTPLSKAAPVPSADPTPDSETNRVLFLLGIEVGNTIRPFTLSPDELNMVLQGVRAAVERPPSRIEDDARDAVRRLFAARSKVVVERETARGAAFVEEQRRRPGAYSSPSGWVLIPMEAGSGDSPQRSDRVMVHFEGRLVDGTVFDSSRFHSAPLSTELTHLIPCWAEALQRMKPGERVTLICPSSTAYGTRGSPPAIPGGATLNFDLTLLGVQKGPSPDPPAKLSL